MEAVKQTNIMTNWMEIAHHKKIELGNAERSKEDVFRNHNPWNLLTLCSLQQWSLFCLKEIYLHQSIIPH